MNHTHGELMSHTHAEKDIKRSENILTATDMKQSNEYSYDHEKKVIIITTNHKRHGILILRY